MVSSVLSGFKKYIPILQLMGPSNCPWQVREAERVIPLLAQRHWGSSLWSRPSSHIRLEPKSSGLPPRTLPVWLLCMFSYTVKMQDTNPTLETLKEITVGSCPKFSDIISLKFKAPRSVSFLFAVHNPNILTAPSCPPLMGPWVFESYLWRVHSWPGPADEKITDVYHLVWGAPCVCQFPVTDS